MKTPRFYSSRRASATRAAFRSIAATGLSLLSLAGAAQAADDIWVYSGDVNNPLATTATTGGGTGNYDDGPNGYWSLNVKPATNTNNAVINNAGTVNITTDQTPVDILLGTIAGGSGTFNQSAGTVTQTLGWFRLGTAGAGSLQPQSNYNMTGGAISLTAGVNQQYNVAEGTYSNVQVTMGGGAGTPTVGGNFGVYNVGRDANSVGSMTLNTGAVFNMNPTAVSGTANTTVSIGNTGNGTVNIAGGTLNIQPTISGNYSLVIGRNSGSNGTLNISGGALNLGGNAAGAATLLQEMWISAATGATGTVNMTGGALNVTSWLAIGRGGNNGNFNMSGGVANVAINNGNISGAGVAATSVGTTSLFGGTMNTPNGMYLAEGGVGTLNVSGTAVMNIYGAVGLRVNTTATTNAVATGTVNLGDGFSTGGLLSVNNVNTTNTVAARSIFNFQGGTLQAKYNNANFFVVGQANVGDFGAIIDSNGVNIGITQALLHSAATTGATDGGLTKLGNGGLILTNAGNNYTGNTTVSGGVLDAQVQGAVPGLNTAGKVTVNSGAVLALGVGYTNSYTLADIDALRNGTAGTGGTFAATFNAGAGIGIDTANTAVAGSPVTSYTYATAITGANVSFAKLGAGTLLLTGANTYTGSTRFYGGLLGGNIGTGSLAFNGGGWQLPANNTTDFSTRAISFNGNATIDTNGNNLTLPQTITGLGGSQLIKQGLGNLTLTGGFNFTQTRAYTPVAQTSGNVFVNAGTLTFTGATAIINTGGAYSSIGQVAGDKGTLNIANGAAFNGTADFNIGDVGGTTAALADGGIVNLSDTGSTLSTASFFVGKASNATTQPFAYGVMNQSGGTHTQTNNAQIGAFGIGQYNLSGGAWNHTGGYLSVARQPGSTGTVDVTGTGVFTDTAVGTRSIIGEQGTGTLNVRNGGVFNANNSTTNASSATLTSGLAALTIGNTAGTATQPTLAVVNLLPGGTINTQSIGSIGGAVANTTSMLNLSGGTLKNTVATGTFIQNLSQANVYGNVGGTVVSGAVIDTTAGNATIAQPLLAPAGQGVTAITASGTGFSTTPFVQITGGGGGTGATAIATVDASGTLTGVTITNPGTGYTTAPTVTVTGPFGTVATSSTATIGNNVSGGLTKIGINTLTLTGANTYTGPTNINVGTLALTGAGSIGASTLINTASGATFSLGAATAFAPTQTLTGTGTIAGAANNLTIAGILAPGATQAAGSVGTLAVNTTGTLTLASTAVYQLDILTAATKDLVTATGATLSVAGTLAVQGSVTAGTTYTLFSGLANETGNFNSVTGVPANLTPTFSFMGGNYNVTFAAVPEPSTWAMGVFGLGMGALWLRRRRLAA